MAVTPFLPPTEDFDSIDEDIANMLLINDIHRTERMVNAAINTELTENQYGAIVSFVFNVGAGNFMASTLRRKVNREEYYAASSEFPRWVYARGKKLAGLIKRRDAERMLFLSNTTEQEAAL